MKKHIPMGPDELGRHPYHPGRQNNVTVPTEVHHSHSRQFEVDASKGKGIARESTAAKQSHIAVHGGMTAQQRYDATSESAQASLRALTGSYDPTTGVPRGKRLTPPTVNPGTRHRNLDASASEQPGVAHARSKMHQMLSPLQEMGQRIMDEALVYSSRDDRQAHGRGR
jgi:hypothetical protein